MNMESRPQEELIADIFGDSESEDEFEGFKPKVKESSNVISDDNEGENRINLNGEENNNEEEEEGRDREDSNEGDSNESQEKEDLDEIIKRSDVVEDDNERERKEEKDENIENEGKEDDKKEISERRLKRILDDSEDEAEFSEKHPRRIIDDSDEEESENLESRPKRIVDSDEEDGNENEENLDRSLSLDKKGNNEENKLEGGEEENGSEDEEEGECSPKAKESEDDSEPEDSRRHKVPDDFVYDFDIMMQKKRESIRHRKRKNIDIINDSDDIIAELINSMKQAAEDDFILNRDRKAATRKLKLLPIVDAQLRKIDLREAFLDAGVLGVITDWLTPLPDRSLPNLQIREVMLKILDEFNIMDVERLKASGIGKAVMYLYKHPKETKENKRRAAGLIANWSRPIFSLENDFHTISREEREHRDHEHMAQAKKRRSNSEEIVTPVKKEPETVLRPGEKGFIPRARVPMPSTRDYVVRPRSNIDVELTRSSSKKSTSRLDKHIRNFMEKKKQMKTQRAVKISIEGNKMGL